MRASFYEAPRFKANSTLHEQTAERAGLAFVTQEALLREQPFLPLNTGRAQGRLRIIKSVEQTGDLSPRTSWCWTRCRSGCRRWQGW